MTGGPCATQGFGRLADRPAQACAETSSRGIVPERSGSTHQVCGQFRDAVAECVATTRRRCPQGAIFSGPPEKTHRLGLYYLLFYDNIGQEEVCAFLRALLRQLRGPLIVLLDNSSTHQGEPIEKLRARHPRLYVEHFPSYSPELNPEEGVWSLSKKELANGCPKDIDELMESIIRVIDGIRRSPAKLRWSILQSELPLFLR